METIHDRFRHFLFLEHEFSPLRRGRPDACGTPFVMNETATVQLGEYMDQCTLGAELIAGLNSEHVAKQKNFLGDTP
jgi:hypothetical protein